MTDWTEKCHLTVSHTHCNSVLPKVFVSGCHFLQQVGDIVGNAGHPGTLTPVSGSKRTYCPWKVSKLGQQI